MTAAARLGSEFHHAGPAVIGGKCSDETGIPAKRPPLKKRPEDDHHGEQRQQKIASLTRVAVELPRLVEVGDRG